MPLDDKVEKMNGGVYGVLKVLLGKAGNNIAGAVNYRRIETYWGGVISISREAALFYWNPCIYNHLSMHCTIYHALYTMI